jgi:transmembrane sensor
MRDDDKLFGEALDLVIRLQNDPENPVARELVRTWLSRGPQHEEIWAEVVEIHGLAGKAMSDSRKAGQTSNLSRRGFLAGGATLAVGAAALYGPGMLERLGADFTTATAELQNIALPDGSRAVLGPSSAIALDFSPSQRKVTLLDGMAFFDVSDDGRPFHAAAGDMQVTARGAAFDISRDAGWRSVSVGRGAVELAAAGSAIEAREQLSAGSWLTLDGESLNAERGQRAADQIAAWRDNRIVAERESIASVVAKIARWKTGRVVIADFDLGERRISGVFDLAQPVDALAAAVLPHGGVVRQISPWLTVIARV